MAGEAEDEQSLFEGSLPPEFSETNELVSISDLEKLEHELRGSNNTGAQALERTNLNFDIEKQRLLHDLHLCKMEVSKKVLQIDNLKADHMAMLEELEEKLQDGEHERNLLQTKLKSQQGIYASAQDEMRNRHESMRSELEKILKRQQDLELINEKLQAEAGELRRNIGLITLPVMSSETFSCLKFTNEQTLSLRDFVLLKIHLIAQPLTEEVAKLKKELHENAHQAGYFKDQYEQIVNKFSDEHKKHADLVVRFQKQSIELKETEKLIKEGDYRIKTFDHIKSERDALRSDFDSLKVELNNVELSYQGLQRERDEMKSDLVAAKQSITLLQRDKEYLSMNSSELNEKVANLEERLRSAVSHAQDMQKAREESYEKFIASRDQSRMDYEDKLKNELDDVKTKMEQDMQRVKTNLIEMHERDRKCLKESYDQLLVEKDRAVVSEREAVERYDKLWQEHQRIKSDSEATVSKIESDARVKLFEADRTIVSLEESLQSARTAQLENDKLSKKLDVFTKEYQLLQLSTEKEITKLKLEIKEKEEKLKSLENRHQQFGSGQHKALFQNFDAVEENDFEFDPFGNVTNNEISHKSKFQYVRRVVELERENSRLSKEIENLQESIRKRETDSYNFDLGLVAPDFSSDQPYQLLLNRLKSSELEREKKERQIREMRSQNSALEMRVTQLQFDIDRLLNNRKEIILIKEALRKQIAVHEASHDSNGEEEEESCVTFSDKENEMNGPSMLKLTKPKWVNKLKNASR